MARMPSIVSGDSRLRGFHPSSPNFFSRASFWICHGSLFEFRCFSWTVGLESFVAPSFFSEAFFSFRPLEFDGFAFTLACDFRSLPLSGGDPTVGLDCVLKDRFEGLRGLDKPAFALLASFP
jgi:hypothetical protein